MLTIDEVSPGNLELLARTLGYNIDDNDDEFRQSPYVGYILDSCYHKKSLDSYVQLFTMVIDTILDNEATSGPPQCTLRQCVAKVLLFPGQAWSSLADGDPNRELLAMDSVLYMLGVFVMMKSYFIPQQNRQRRILLVNGFYAETRESGISCMKKTLAQMLQSSGLLPNPDEKSWTGRSEEDVWTISSSPHPPLGFTESRKVSAKALNAFRLSRLGAVRILWTNNISRHLLLSTHGSQFFLELFAIPSALEGNMAEVLGCAGLTADLLTEIRDSYANLFNPTTPSKWHRYLGFPLGAYYWCLCLHCTSKRLSDRELQKLQRLSGWSNVGNSMDSNKVRYDSRLTNLMQQKAGDWDQIGFNNFWSRLSILDAHLANSKPWNFWVIFQDRRDSLQFWTFCFGAIILLFTLLQVCLGIAQVISGFQ